VSTPTQRILDLLDQAIPAPRRGTRVLDIALQRAGLDDLPQTTEHLKAFVRTSLRVALEDELGAQLAHQVANDLDAALTPALRRCPTLPAAPSSRRMRRVTERHEGVAVLVVGADRLRNASIARVLLRQGFVVSTAHDLAEITTATASATPAALVVDECCALDTPDILRDLLGRAATVALVHNCSNPPRAEDALRMHGIDRVVAIREGSSSQDLLSALSHLMSV
jgi:hypothetical protein